MSRWQPRFLALWLGQACSLIGSALTQFVLVWWITQDTHSPGALATAGIMMLLPGALFSPLGGAIADRFSRRVVMFVTDAITAACMLILVLLFTSQQIQLWHIYLLMFVRATMQSFQEPAALASAANLVPEHWLGRVAGMNQALEGILTIASAPLGALALSLLPIQGALMIDVVTALLGLIPLLIFAIPQPQRPETHCSPIALWEDIREGARYVWRRPGLVQLYAITALVVLIVMPAFSLTPLLVIQHFHGGLNEVALMEGLAGLGIIAGGIVASIWPPRRRRMFTMLASFAITCFTVTLTALTPGNLLWLAALWWTLNGFAFSIGNAPLLALLQSRVPNALQGRILALLRMVYGLAAPLGLAIAGPLGEVAGVRWVFIAGGILSTLVCIAGGCSPVLWNLEHMEDDIPTGAIDFENRT